MAYNCKFVRDRVVISRRANNIYFGGVPRNINLSGKLLFLGTASISSRPIRFGKNAEKKERKRNFP